MNSKIGAQATFINKTNKQIDQRINPDKVTSFVRQNNSIDDVHK